MSAAGVWKEEGGKEETAGVRKEGGKEEETAGVWKEEEGGWEIQEAGVGIGGGEGDGGGLEKKGVAKVSFF